MSSRRDADEAAQSITNAEARDFVALLIFAFWSVDIK